MATNFELTVSETIKKLPTKTSQVKFKEITKGVDDATFFGNSLWSKVGQFEIKLSEDNLVKIKKNLDKSETISNNGVYKLEETKLKFKTSNKTRSKNKDKPTASSKTALAESAVCITTAFLLQQNRDLSTDDLEDKKQIDYLTTRINDIVDIGELDSKKGIKEVLNFLASNPEWYSTSVKTAKILKDKLNLNSNHCFHRDSAFMNNIYKQALKHIKKLNKVGLKIGGDKWNPGDIWIAKGKGNKGFSSKNDLTELNEAVLKKFKDADIMGVSLKKLGKLPTYSVYNLESQSRSFYFCKIKKPAGELMDSKDMYIVTKKGVELQIRSFSNKSDIQIEIKGEAAAGGKAGFGAVAYAINKVTGQKLLKYTEINKMNQDSKIKLIQKYYKAGFGNTISSNLIIDTITKKKNKANKLYKDWSLDAQNDYWSSKIQALQISSIISNSKQQDDIMTIIVGYAASLGLYEIFDASVYAKIY